jgi:hypothetical protein
MVAAAAGFMDFSQCHMAGLIASLVVRREAAMKTHGVRRMAERVTAVIQEMNEAQQRMMALRMSGDWYLGNPGAAPDTYGEFLMRTSGPLIHEPRACKRAGRLQ